MRAKIVLIFMVALFISAGCGKDDKEGVGETPVDAQGDTDSSPVDAGSEPDISNLPACAQKVFDFGPEFGTACESDADCGSGVCIGEGENSVCTHACEGDCPCSWGCESATSVGGITQEVCVPAPGDVCGSCTLNEDCGGAAYCAAGEGGGQCLRPCTGEGDYCPLGQQCRSVTTLSGDEMKLCQHDAGCCATISEGVEESCVESNSEGSCSGLRLCRGAQGWGICDAWTPSSELCDGLDNNCDGATDEGLGDLCACGDGVCSDDGGEDLSTCPYDCKVCGDGICSPSEDPGSCKDDCCSTCGDGFCYGYGCGENPSTCSEDCGATCGNGQCENGENPFDCAEDCKFQECGNLICEPSDGGPESCPQDCGATCGNCVCEGGESWLSCPTDCGYCGDGVCSDCPNLNESDSCGFDCADTVITDCGALEDGQGCDDENPCTANDQCQAGSCEGSPIAECCQQDSDCPEDGDLCNGLTTCDQSAFSPSNWRCIQDPDTAVFCLDSGLEPCAANTCEPASGECTLEYYDGTSCSDESNCTKSDACLQGACVGNEPVECTALDQCHDVGVCDPASGVCDNPAKADGEPCNDGDACSLSDACQDGACAFNGYTVCTNNDPCRVVGTCDTLTGECSSPPAEDGTSCDDGDPCTLSDTCVTGECAASDPKLCTEPPNKSCYLLEGNCDTSSGNCEYTSKTNGEPCNDSDPCTLSESCQSGECTADNLVTCEATDQCHSAGTCDPSTGLCSDPAKPDETECDDGDACTTYDDCQEGLCTGQVPIVCVASDQCHLAGTCAPESGECSDPPKAEDTECDDGDACTQDDDCLEGVCTGLVPVECTASDDCHIPGICDPSTGTCDDPSAALNTPCEDGDACSLNDLCDGSGVCEAGESKDCDDSLDCTSDDCDAEAGCTYAYDSKALATRGCADDAQGCSTTEDLKLVVDFDTPGNQGPLTCCFSTSHNPWGSMPCEDTVKLTVTDPDGNDGAPSEHPWTSSPETYFSEFDESDGQNGWTNSEGASIDGQNTLFAVKKNHPDGSETDMTGYFHGQFAGTFSKTFTIDAAEGEEVYINGKFFVIDSWDKNQGDVGKIYVNDDLVFQFTCNESGASLSFSQGQSYVTESYTISDLPGNWANPEFVIEFSIPHLMTSEPTLKVEFHIGLNSNTSDESGGFSVDTITGFNPATATPGDYGESCVHIVPDREVFQLMAETQQCKLEAITCSQWCPGAPEKCVKIESPLETLTCDDENPCTHDSCQTDGTCSYENNTEPCEDGDLCTDNVCDAGTCEASPRDCEDGLVCTHDSCDADKGCLNFPEDFTADAVTEDSNNQEGVDTQSAILDLGEDLSDVPLNFCFTLGPYCQESDDAGVANVRVSPQGGGYFIGDDPSTEVASIPSMPQMFNNVYAPICVTVSTEAAESFRYLHITHNQCDISSALVSVGCGLNSKAKIRSVATASDHTCSVLGDGTVWCWGANNKGQLGDGTTDGKVTFATQVVLSPEMSDAPLDQVVDIQAHDSRRRTCARRLDGSLWCWGDGSDGVCGDGSSSSDPRVHPVRVRSSSTYFDAFDDVSDFALSEKNSCAIAGGKRVFCWGDKTYLLGRGPEPSQDSYEAVPVWTKNANDAINLMPVGFEHIAMSHDFACVAAKDTSEVGELGDIYCWGEFSEGYAEAVENDWSDLEEVKTLEGGSKHLCALVDDKVLCMGDNEKGQLGHGSATPSPKDELIGFTNVLDIQGSQLSDVVAISAGLFHTCALKSDRSTWCWGQNTYLGLDAHHATEITGAPEAKLPVEGGVRSLSGTSSSHCTIASDSGNGEKLFCQGENHGGSLGLGFGRSSSATFEPTPIETIHVYDPIITMGSDFMGVVDWGMNAFAWGIDKSGDSTLSGGVLSNGDVRGNSDSPEPILNEAGQQLTRVQEMEFYNRQAVAVVGDDYHVVTWGVWPDVELQSDGETEAGMDYAVPTTLIQDNGQQGSPLINITEVGSGHGFACARSLNSDVFCWGNGEFGTLGPDVVVGKDEISVTDAIRMSPGGDYLVGVEDMGVGERHVCAVVVDYAQNGTPSSVWCWGANDSGQLGDNTNNNSSTPRQVLIADDGSGNGPTLLDNVAEVVAGAASSCARRNDETIWCWGRDDLGQLGNGEPYANSSTAVQVGGNPSSPLYAETIGMGDDHACALDYDGIVYCWGNAEDGRLGVSDISKTATPQTVLNTGTVSAIFVQGSATCVTEDGDAPTLKCFGKGRYLLANNQNHFYEPQEVILLPPGCPAGWEGDNCEVNINDCDPNPCQNNGICVDGVAEFSCECGESYYGPVCEYTNDLD